MKLILPSTAWKKLIHVPERHIKSALQPMLFLRESLNSLSFNPLLPRAPHMARLARFLISIKEGIIQKIHKSVATMSR